MSVIAVRRSRRWLFIGIAILSSMAVTLVLLLGADLYLHHRAERSAGLNRWGYRGAVVAKKQPGETRIAMLGGSTVFGYGVFSDQTLPALLERELRAAHPSRRVSVINLGFNNEGAYALQPTLEDFAYLRLDIAAFYTGYNDYWGDAGPNTALFRHESPVFRAFGYFPILPLILKEKAVAIRAGGQLIAANEAAAFGAAKPVFTPSAAERASATAMEAGVAISNALSGQLDRLSRRQRLPVAKGDGGCPTPWTSYCDSLVRAITLARGKGIKVAVIMPPLMTRSSRARHVDQQRATLAMLARRFAGDASVRAVDLSGAVDLTDRHVSFDEMHLDPDGNAIVARALTPHLLAMMGAS